MNKRIFTIPNLLDFFRIIASPLIGWLILTDWKYTVLALGFVFATDLFDGYIARNFNQKSEFGEILDPIADKVIFFFVLFPILIREKLFLWLWIFSIMTIIFLIMFVVLRPQYKKRGVVVNLLGKASVFINCFILMAMVWDYRSWMIYVFTFFVALPQMNYFYKFTKKL